MNGAILVKIENEPNAVNKKAVLLRKSALVYVSFYELGR